MVQYIVYPGRGGTPLEPQLFYNPDLVFSPNPFNQLDWPVPRGYEYHNQLRTLTQGPAPVFVSQLPLGSADGQNELWGIPVYAPYPIQLRTLINSPAPVFVQLPFNQTNWPNPTLRIRDTLGWTWSYNLNLIGQDKFPVGETYTTALPPPSVDTQVRTWLVSRVPSTAVQNPFRQTDWPNPGAYLYPVQLRTLVNTPAPVVTVVTQLPFGQTDWPLTRDYQRVTQSWTWQYNLNLIGQDHFPVGEMITALTPVGYPPQVPTLINSPAPVIVVTTQVPFHQTDWPLPGSYPRQLFSWASWYNLNLIGQDQFPVGENTTGGQNAQFGLILSPEYPIQLRTLTNAPSPTFVAPAQLPTGEYVLWSLPYGAVYPVQSITENNIPLLTFVPPKLPPGTISTSLPGQPFYPSQIASITSGPAPVFVPVPPVTDLHFKPLLITIGRMGHLGGLS